MERQTDSEATLPPGGEGLSGAGRARVHGSGSVRRLTGMPIEGRGLKFKVAGIPITIDWTFPVVMIVFGLAAGLGLADTGWWLLIVLVSVLWHELGHATALAAYGRRSRIVIHSVFGLTVSDDGPELRDTESIAVSLAGPLAGAALGAVLLVVHAQDVAAPGSTWEFLLSRLVWINLGWGLLNLLPIVPLDGGHVLQRLVHMVSPRHTDTIPAYVTIAVATPLAIAAFAVGQPFLGLFAGFFAYGGVRALGEARSAAHFAGQKARAAVALAKLDSPNPQAAIDALEPLAHEPLPPSVGDPVKVGLAWALLWRSTPGDLHRVRELTSLVGPHTETSLLAGAAAFGLHRGPEAYALLARGFAMESSQPPAWFLLHLGLDRAEVDHLADWIDQMDLYDRHRGLSRLAVELDRAGRPADGQRVRSRLTRPVGRAGHR